MYIKVYEAKNTTYSDQTGCFPFHSKRGYKYITVMVEIDSNAVLFTPMKNRTYAEMQCAYLQLLNPTKGAGFAPKRHVLDNKILDSMKALIKYTCQLELVPLHCHSCNGSRSGHQSLQTTFPQHLIRGGDTLPQITIETSPPAC